MKKWLFTSILVLNSLNYTNALANVECFLTTSNTSTHSFNSSYYSYYTSTNQLIKVPNERFYFAEVSPSTFRTDISASSTVPKIDITVSGYIFENRITGVLYGTVNVSFVGSGRSDLTDIPVTCYR